LIEQSIDKNLPMPAYDQAELQQRRQQIIDGALQVFASKGFEKATNKDIAQAAKIGSPGLIYHYFKDKRDLFQQVLEQRIPIVQLLAQRGEEMMTKAPQEALTLFADAFLKCLENPTSVALSKLVMSEAFREPMVAEMFNKVGPGREFAFLIRYLEQQMSAGVLKPIDPGAAARCFIGPLIAYIFTQEIFLQPDTRRLSAETMVKTTVEVFLRGMLVPHEGAVFADQPVSQWAGHL
jgi:TetR/AcrR family transcriptional regulator, mexJK operon transcriptional repressor